MPRLVDTHCHLHFPPYDADRESVLSHMREEDVWGITVGTSAASSKNGIVFAEQTDGVWATVGYHPEHLTSAYRDPTEGDVEPFKIEDIKRLAISSKKVVAIGETGLDFFRIDKERDQTSSRELQEKAFRQHIALAHELDLPLVIHCRDALTYLAEVVQDEQSQGKNVRGVVHCFTGTWEEAKPLLDLGLHLSFTGIITFPPKKTDDPEHHVHRVVERMPLERLLVETDAPWLTPVPYRGKRNEPSYVRFVAEEVAKLRKIEYGDVSAQTTQNAKTLFRLEAS